MAKLVFLGGTVGNNPWRVELIDRLIDRGVDVGCLFNPVVSNWNEEAQAREEDAKALADYMIFYLGSPEQDDNPISAYSMVEATMALYDAPKTTVVVFDHNGIEGHALKAVKQTEKVLRKRFPEACILGSLVDAIDWLESVLR
jgi:uncharacterized phage-like protein YoqJ